jgi:hypothetical protein
MSNDTAKTQTTNIVPVQGIFEPAPTFALVSLIGPAGTPFYPNVDPDQSGLNITSSTINSTTIGLTTPAAGAFTTATVATSPTSPTDVANKQYVDYYAAGLSWKEPVLVATTGNLTLSGTQTIDTIAVVAGDRVLVKDQSTASQNGIYTVSAGAWSRSIGADDWDEYLGAITFVIEGSQAGSAWYCTAQPGGTLGTTAINWSNFSVSSTYTAGTGLTLAGTQFSITNTGVSAATYGAANTVPVIAVNAQGQITSATNTAIAINGNQITSGTIGSSYLSGSYTGITGVGTLTDLTVTNTITGSISGSASSATSAVTATNIAGGASGSIPYQTGSGATALLAKGTDGQILALASGLPAWIDNQTGTVTSVSGTGTVSGISLSGTVTSSGNLTLGGTLDLSSPPIIGGTAPNSATFTTVTATSFDTNVAAAGVTLSGTSLVADGSDTNINMLITPKGTGGLGINGSPTGDVAGSTLTAKFCVKQDENGPVAGFVKANNSSAYPGSTVYGCRSRGTLLSPTIVQDNDTLFSLLSLGFDGTDLAPAAQIDFEVDGTPGANDMPGKIVFKTSPDGSQTTTEAMNIDSTQTVNISKLNVTGTIGLSGSTGTSGYVMTSNGASAPTWSALPASGITITDDTTTNATRYLTFTSATTGSITGENVASTKLQFNPSSGVLTATGFSGSGANLTSVVNSITGTSNQVVASASTGAVTLSLPQSIATGSSVQFGSFGVGTAASGTTGEIRATNNVTAYYSSDKKFKENIRQIDNATEKTLFIGGKYFDWTEEYINAKGGADGYFVRKNDIGVIAQDVQKVLPEAVRTREDGSLAVDYQKLVSLAFAAIAELKTEIEALKGN